MSIRAVLIVVFLTLVALLGAQVMLSARAGDRLRDVARAERLRHDSWRLAEELRRSSDELTRLARTFVVTGDPIYEEYFHDVLAIRNGEQARPAGYAGIYWDFVIADRSQPDADGRKIALEAQMRELGFTDAELDRLGEARRRSDALVRMEEIAMHAVKGRFADGNGDFTVVGEPNLELARAIMHGEEYHREKARIMEPLAEFFAMIDARTGAAAEEMNEASHVLARSVLLLAIAALVFALAASIVLQRRTLVPIQRMIDRLRDIAEGDGDLTRRLATRRRDELGTLASWFDRFVQLVHDMVSEVAGSSTTVTTAASEIAATAAAQRETIDSVTRSIGSVTSAVAEISATSRELARSTEEVGRSSREAVVVASAGRTELAEMESRRRHLRTATDAIADRLASLADRAEAINSIVTMIVKVADQTNLLAVNAAIEADKAGEHGAGFRVVAREIHRLAEQTASATLRIEEDVRGIQSAMTEGLDEMTRFRGDVGAIVDRMDAVGGHFGTLIDGARALDERFTAVGEGMAQQAIGLEEIRGAMVALDGSAARTRSAQEELVAASHQLRDASVTLDRRIARFRLA